MRAVQRSGERVGRRRSPASRGEIVTGLHSARTMARAWSTTVPERQRQQAAWAFVKTAIDEYADGRGVRIMPPPIALAFALDNAVTELARTVGREATGLPIEHACYQLSATYTALVPNGMRSILGMYYTPPALTDRLLDMAAEAGVDWSEASALDPACGGGAFLLPVALRMRDALRHLPPTQRVASIVARLRGFEIDPFAAWLTQTWLELALADLLEEASRRLPHIVQVCDTLHQEPNGRLYDLVIGNPPYGRVTLSGAQRKRFSRSLFGHANLYGVFTDAALRWAKPSGVIAYVTPTSFLAGEYFKSLRQLLADEAPPVAIDFITARRGVFEDVLQETLLATYRKSGKADSGAAVHYLAVASETASQVTHAGGFNVPSPASAPWLAPRQPSHQALIDRLAHLPNRLEAWGYRVSTGPLVWNRFKDQLRAKPGKDTFPLIWAEAVTSDGRFIYRAEKREHQPYFRVEPGDEWLKVNAPCVLVQRTTAKEQARRLIAAEMPASFVKRHAAVVVENHLNMIRADGGKPKVSTAALAAVLNSSIADETFRCISGSVAVSAFELEALPLPSPEDMRSVEKLISRRASRQNIDDKIRHLYLRN